MDNDEQLVERLNKEHDKLAKDWPSPRPRRTLYREAAKALERLQAELAEARAENERLGAFVTWASSRLKHYDEDRRPTGLGIYEAVYEIIDAIKALTAPAQEPQDSLREKIRSDPDLETEAGVLHLEARQPSATSEAERRVVDAAKEWAKPRPWVDQEPPRRKLIEAVDALEASDDI